ncbi:MAG: hypothetical protein PUP91_21325 [Rhizonema sp. PD37]|nr:hypothetical protein [Rhizonema sp. PD37]
MPIQQSPLTVIIDPPGIQSGMAGDTLQLYVVISNQSNQSAVIDVFFDEASETIRQWCQTLQERLALAPQQSSELTFQFEIPVDALPGTYDYTLVVDAPEHFPEDTPIQYPRQLKVMLRENTVIRVKDPTFSLKPATNPTKAAILKLGEPLQVEVRVNNRSDRVDRFYLTCPDIEEDWFTIRYQLTGLEASGLLSGPSGLELNPNSQGQIWIIFHPPASVFAGSYSPTIRLRSDNSPDLVLLDLLYIQIPAIHRLNVELNTLLGKVSRTSGQYEIKLTNQGNIPRELKVGIKSRDERQLYTYHCEPHDIRVLPSRSSKVNLTVKPGSWWQRQWIGSGLNLNFVVELEDKESLPLPENLPRGSLVWNARPWWQLLLVVFAVLGSLLGLSFLIWWQFFKPPASPKIESFTSDSIIYVEGDKVLLNWKVNNFQEHSKLQLKIDGPVPSTPQDIDITQKDLCQNQQQILLCANYNSGVTQPGDYTFTLIAVPTDKQENVSSSIKVKINEKPIPKIVDFRPDNPKNLEKPEYPVGGMILLKWQIWNLDNLSNLQIFARKEGGNNIKLRTFDLSNKINELIPKSCHMKQKEKVVFYTCENISVKTPPPGKYILRILAFPNNHKQLPSVSLPITVDILPIPLKIASFTLNGSQEPTRVINDGTPINFSWKVDGSEDIDVELSLVGKVKASDSRQIKANQALPPIIELTATDKFGGKDSKRFAIKVNPPPQPPSPQPPSPQPPFSSHPPQSLFPIRPFSSPPSRTIPTKPKK